MNYIICMWSFKSLTKENSRLKGTIESLSERNSQLESELIVLERLKIENSDSKKELVRSLQREESLKKELKKEHDVIKSWNNSSRITRSVIENRIKKTFLDPNGSIKKMLENPSTNNYPSTDNSDNEYPLKKKNSTNDNCLSKKKKMPTSKTILKMKEKYGGTENFVKEGTPPEEKNENVESKDTSSSSKKLDKTNDMVKTKEIKKNKNRNGKVGINKHNNYDFDVYAPRKVCAKCGSTNHLFIDYKIVSTHFLILLLVNC